MKPRVYCLKQRIEKAVLMMSHVYPNHDVTFRQVHLELNEIR